MPTVHRFEIGSGYSKETADLEIYVVSKATGFS